MASNVYHSCVTCHVHHYTNVTCAKLGISPAASLHGHDPFAACFYALSLSTQSHKVIKSHTAWLCTVHTCTQRLPATIAQLVDASPSATEDGALLLGSHSSSVFVVDGKSGALLRVLSSHGQQLLHQHHTGTLHTPLWLCEDFAKQHLMQQSSSNICLVAVLQRSCTFSWSSTPC